MTTIPLLPAQCVVTASCAPSGDQAGDESPTFSSTPHCPLPSGFIEAIPPTAEKAIRPFARRGVDPRASEPSKQASMTPSAATSIDRDIAASLSKTA